MCICSLPRTIGSKLEEENVDVPVRLPPFRSNKFQPQQDCGSTHKFQNDFRKQAGAEKSLSWVSHHCSFGYTKLRLKISLMTIVLFHCAFSLRNLPILSSFCHISGTSHAARLCILPPAGHCRGAKFIKDS